MRLILDYVLVKIIEEIIKVFSKIKLGRLNHVAIAVPDLPKAISFYRDILGASISEAKVI